MGKNLKKLKINDIIQFIESKNFYRVIQIKPPEAQLVGPLSKNIDGASVDLSSKQIAPFINLGKLTKLERVIYEID